MRIFLFIVFSVCCSYSFSQEAMGVKGGLSIVTLANSLTGSNQNANGGSGSYRPSYHGGFFYNSSGDGMFDFRMELLYSNKGYGTGRRANSNRINTHLHYFTLPLLGVFKPIDGLDLQFGAEVGYLLAARIKGEVFVASTGNTSTVNGDVLALYKKIDAAILLGISHTFESGITIGARYSFGVLNINNVQPNSGNTQSTVSTQTRTTMLSLEYALFQN